ncbi:MAG: phosphate ABC transporter ATP-binding protein [Bacteroidales bacterium]|jgi:phosphate transport system ATP-binding protein
MNPKIRIQNLSLSIDRQPILKDVNLTIPKNKITVILGPSGCGKTTLLKSLNRLTDLIPGVQRSGEILLDGVNILNGGQDLVDIRQKMGLLAQRPYPLPMSIYNNITFGLRISGRYNRQFLDKRVEHYLKMVNLWEEVKHRLKDPASALSIGQQQRLCLARGLAVDPEIILADEPTSALDPISSRMIEEKFLELKNQYTIVLVTHILRQARRMADYVVLMYLGEVIEQGTPDELFNNPQHPVTKSYLSGQFY